MFVILLDKFKLVQRDGAVQYSGRELSPAMWSRSPSDLVQLIRYRVAGRRVVVEGKPVVRVIGMLSKVEEDGRRFTGRQASILLLDPRKTTSVTDSTIFKGELKGVTFYSSGSDSVPSSESDHGSSDTHSSSLSTLS